MLFNSLQFVFFFPVVTVGYFWLPHRVRWLWLLAASCVFYMAFVPIYILILAITIAIDYVAALLIDKAEGRARLRYLVISIFSTCAVLFVFKYFNFFNSNFLAAAQFFQLNYPAPVLDVLLPIGLSFHTFQSLSYVIEVYRGNQRPERHFGIYALYVMFYPQLVAGPIERPQHLLHQFREVHSFDYQRVANGLKLMAWGMFKKVVIADRLALLVNAVYGNPQAHDGPALVVATIFFAFQIYCDFSGYSDIAIGAAQVMGFRLVDNFNRPYSARGIADFWHRWHISLSTWFRDYVYIPLGGNRVSRPRWYLNLLLTFTISGLWHGANWTYVFWGLLNGMYLVAEHATAGLRAHAFKYTGLDRFPAVRSTMAISATFGLVCFAWIFFRARSLSDAWYIVTHLAANDSMALDLAWWSAFLTVEKSGMTIFDFVLAIAAIAFMEVFHFVQGHSTVRTMLVTRPWPIRYGFYYLLVTSVLVLGVFQTPQAFIYFQF
jgi:alginate O-acetyltransferase complex protein AlgI